MKLKYINKNNFINNLPREYYYPFIDIKTHAECCIPEQLKLSKQDCKLIMRYLNRLHDVLDEIDLMIYRLRFIDFLDKESFIDNINIILNDIRHLSQIRDVKKFNEYLKEYEHRGEQDEKEAN